MSYPYLIQGNNITVVIGNQPHTISKTHITYQRVFDAIKAGDWETVKDIIEPKKVVLSFGQGNVSIEGEQLFWKGRELHNALATRMIAMLQEGFSIEPMVLFMENLFSNPSKRSVDELYGFLEKNNLPITPDGHFLAYKRVRANYFDCHSGTMDNSIGKVVEMQRNEVDDNKDRTCSSGLHFCSHSYLGHFGGDRVVIVKINPADVVSIPSDYNDAKGRACRYEVIGEVANDPEDKVEFTKSVQSNANSAMPEEDAHWEISGGDEWDEYDFVETWIEEDEQEDAEVEEGDDFYTRGYDDGFNGNLYTPFADTKDEHKEYAMGFEDGETDAMFDEPQRFKYVTHTLDTAAPVVPVSSTPTQAAWPFPTGNK
jgi:hypothetical protein